MIFKVLRFWRGCDGKIDVRGEDRLGGCGDLCADPASGGTEIIHTLRTQIPDGFVLIRLRELVLNIRIERFTLARIGTDMTIN